MTPSGTSTTRARCARRTAIKSRRSRTTLCSGDHSSTSGSEAYREARTSTITGALPRSLGELVKSYRRGTDATTDHPGRDLFRRADGGEAVREAHLRDI